MNRNTLIAAAGAIILVAMIALFFAFRPTNGAQSDQAQQADSTVKQATVDQSKRTEAPPAKVIPIQFQQQGLYRLDMQEFQTSTLADRYSFIKQGLETYPDMYGGDDMSAAELPPRIQLAHLVIPEKKLDMVALYGDYPSWCDNGYCLFQLYIRQGNDYNIFINTMTKRSNYLVLDNTSISLVICDSDRGYTQRRLEDGALDKPMPINAPGYFIPQQTPYVHDGMEKCP